MRFTNSLLAVIASVAICASAAPSNVLPPSTVDVAGYNLHLVQTSETAISPKLARRFEFAEFMIGLGTVIISPILLPFELVGGIIGGAITGLATGLGTCVSGAAAMGDAIIDERGLSKLVGLFRVDEGYVCAVDGDVHKIVEASKQGTLKLGEHYIYSTEA